MRAIQLTIVLTTLFASAYVLSPIYSFGLSTQVSGLATTLATPLLVRAWAAFIGVGAILAGIGIYKKNPRLRGYGWTMIFLARLYQVIAIWLAAGLLPLSWIYPFTLGIIVLILWARSRVVDE